MSTANYGDSIAQAKVANGRKKNVRDPDNNSLVIQMQGR